MSDVEQLLISSVINDGRMVEALDAGITPLFFVSDRWRKSWEWIIRYHTEHGELPKEAAFKRSLPTHKLVDVDEPLSAIIAEMMERRRHRLVTEGLQEAVGKFDGIGLADDDRVNETLAAMQRTIASINTEVTRKDIVSSDKFLGPLITRVLNMQRVSLIGIPTGFPTIDEATGGLQREQLVTFVALPKRGKSSVALKIAQTAVQTGNDVMMFSFEMSNEEMMMRYLSMGAGVNLTDMQRGRLTMQDRDRIEEFEADASEWTGKLILVHDIASVLTVGGIDAQIEMHNDLPLVVIDGTYMMMDEQGEPPGSPRALTNITRSLKRLAQRRKLCVLNTTQALESRTTKGKGVEMGSIGYTSSFAQDSDTLFGMDRDDLMSPYAKLKVMAARNALGVETTISLNYAIGVIEETSGMPSQVRTSYKYEDAGDDDID